MELEEIKTEFLKTALELLEHAYEEETKICDYCNKIATIFKVGDAQFCEECLDKSYY